MSLSILYPLLLLIPAGTGCFESPIMVVPLVINFTGPKAKGSALYFREIRCRVSPQDQSYFAENRPIRLNYILRAGGSLPNQQVLLEIPLDQARLSRMDRLRKGGDLKLRLDTELVADELIQIGDSGKFPDPEVWGFKRQYIAHQQIHTAIPRSNWIELVLPNTHFGRIHLIELPAIPIAASSGLQTSFEALQQASKMEREGHYLEAISIRLTVDERKPIDAAIKLSGLSQSEFARKALLYVASNGIRIT